MKPALKYLSLLLLAFLLSTGKDNAQDISWKPFEFLLGTWVGEGTGKPGEATGGFSFSLDLDKRICVRRNYAVYPATSDRPNFRHDDLMIIYPGADSVYKAIYFDNEGHVINYTVTANTAQQQLIFTSTDVAGPKFRLTNMKISDKEIQISFSIAQPGSNEFKTYITAQARKQD